MSVDSRDAKTSDEFAKRIKEYTTKNSDYWITCGDWEHELPRKEWIDWFIDIWDL